MRETDGFRHVGVVDQRILLFAQMSALWWSSAAEPDRSARVEVMATESPHKASSARVSTSRHGQSGGERSMGRPDRLTRRPGMATVRRAGAMGLTRRRCPVTAITPDDRRTSSRRESVKVPWRNYMTGASSGSGAAVCRC